MEIKIILLYKDRLIKIISQQTTSKTIIYDEIMNSNLLNTNEKIVYITFIEINNYRIFNIDLHDTEILIHEIFLNPMHPKYSIDNFSNVNYCKIFNNDEEVIKKFGNHTLYYFVNYMGNLIDYRRQEEQRKIENKVILLYGDRLIKIISQQITQQITQYNLNIINIIDEIKNSNLLTDVEKEQYLTYLDEKNYNIFDFDFNDTEIFLCETIINPIHPNWKIHNRTNHEFCKIFNNDEEVIKQFANHVLYYFSDYMDDLVKKTRRTTR
jgi:hypothetical protein